LLHLHNNLKFVLLTVNFLDSLRVDTFILQTIFAEKLNIPADNKNKSENSEIILNL